MSATNFNTRNDTYRKLLGNGLTYRIPRFQRDYSWEEEHWEDLWLDILGTLAEGGEPAHYLGYLVLQSNDDKLFEVIDGQQRLTTLSLIVLATLKNLQRLIDEGQDADNNRRRLEQLRQSYIGYLDPVTLVPRSKLTLNRNNDDYFQTYLVPLAHLPKRGFRASEHLLRKAFEWFDKKISAYAKQHNDNAGTALARLVEDMSDRVFFTVISVTDELNAYKVFETLNARGVRLSATDLLKNYLFSVLHRGREHEHEMKILEQRWENLVGRLGSESFPDFLRAHWNSRKRFVRQTELFKTIRAQVPDRASVFDLLRGMEEDLDTYLALTHPDTSAWPPTWKAYAGELRMFSVRQPFPLLLAARRGLDDAGFETLLRVCVVISFRYNVISNLPPSEQEGTYNRAAEQLAKGEITHADQILSAVQSLYPSDEKFHTAFAEKIIKTTQSRNKRIVRYILCRLEKQLSGQDYDFDSDSYNLEHVFPQNPQEGWETFSEEEAEAVTYRLGNMALLQRSANKDLANEEYARKREVYAVSGFMTTRRIAEENHNWTPERINRRQASMADIAKTVWRVGQLA